MRLREALKDLAGQAAAYGDHEAALWTARRRRSRRRVVVPALALVVTAATVVSVNSWTPTHEVINPEPVVAATASPTAVLDLMAPVTAAELPEGRAVGPAALAYRVAENDVLVTRQGQRYLLAPGALDGRGTSISPDGRWLVQNGHIRDLAGTANRVLPATWVRAWSPDGTWLLMERPQLQQVLVNTANGQSIDVHTAGIGVLDDGNIVVGDGGIDDVTSDLKVAALRMVDPASGALRRQVTIDARAVLTGEEAVKGRLGIVNAWFGPDEQVLLTVAGRAAPSSAAVLATLPDAKQITPIPRIHGNQAYLPIGFTGRQVFLKSHEEGGPSPTADKNPVRLLEWSGAGTRLRYELPAEAAVLPPGAHSASY